MATQSPISTFSTEPDVQQMIKREKVFDGEIAYVDTGKQNHIAIRFLQRISRSI